MNEFGDLDLEDFNEEGSGGFSDLREPGIHDVKLRHISVEKKSNGVIAWSVTVNGGGEYDDTFYEAALRFKSGKEFGVDFILKPLLVLCGVSNIVYEDKTVKTKDGHKVIKVIAGATDVDFKIVVQRQWSTYRSDYEPKLIRVASEDGRTASEVKQGVSPSDAKQLAKVNFKDKTSDKDGKDPEVGGSKSKGSSSTEDDNDFDDDFDV